MKNKKLEMMHLKREVTQERREQICESTKTKIAKLGETPIHKRRDVQMLGLATVAYLWWKTQRWWMTKQ